MEFLAQGRKQIRPFSQIATGISGPGSSAGLCDWLGSLRMAFFGTFGFDEPSKSVRLVAGAILQ